MIAFLADWLLVILLLLGVASLAAGTSWSEKKRVYGYVIMAGLTSLLVGKLMSLVYQPAVARPFLEKGAEAGAAYIDNPGFPSDHLLLATVVVLAVAVLVRKRWLSILMVCMVIGMGAGRVMALVHTPLDIIGGVLAGLSGGMWYFFLTKNQER